MIIQNLQELMSGDLLDNLGKLLQSLNETVIIICSHPVAPVGTRIKPNGRSISASRLYSRICSLCE